MLNHPTVSIIVPNYNHQAFLVSRLDSIFAQTFTDFEVILLDDASTDGSRAVLDAYRPDERITARVYNTVNSGSPFAQWNRGGALARGKYLWIAESDDIAHPQFLAEMVTRLEAHSSVGIAYCQSNIIDEQGRIVGSAQEYLRPLGEAAQRWESDFVADGPTECALYLARMNTIPNASAALLRRSVWQKVGGADETRRLNGDYKLWCAMLLQSDVTFASSAWNDYRRHGGTVRNATYQSGRMMEEAYSFVQWLEKQVTLAPPVREAILNDLMDRWTTWTILFGLSRRNRQVQKRILQQQRALDSAALSRFFQRFAHRLGQRLRFARSQ